MANVKQVSAQQGSPPLDLSEVGCRTATRRSSCCPNDNDHLSHHLSSQWIERRHSDKHRPWRQPGPNDAHLAHRRQLHIHIYVKWWFCTISCKFYAPFLSVVELLFPASYFNLRFFPLAVYDLLSFWDATPWRTYWGFGIGMMLRPFPGFCYRVEIEFSVFTHDDKWQSKDFKEACWGFILCFDCAWWRSQQWTTEGTVAPWVIFLIKLEPCTRLCIIDVTLMDLIISTLGEQQVQQGAQPKGIGPWKR